MTAAYAKITEREETREETDRGFGGQRVHLDRVATMDDVLDSKGGRKVSIKEVEKLYRYSCWDPPVELDTIPESAEV